MAEQSLERLDQEITLHLQQIDSNLSYCFNKITQDVIPHVTKYGTVCDQVMDSSNWLKIMFQEAGNLQIDSVAATESPVAASKYQPPAETTDQSSLQTLFPGKPRLSPDTSSMMAPPIILQKTSQTPEVTTTTTTGKVLQLPDSSDDENEREASEKNRTLGQDPEQSGQAEQETDPDGSTMQRQRRKRKLSLLLQQQFGSSSSSVAPSPAQLKRPTTSNFDSSPVRKDASGQIESTKHNPVEPGTVIYFPTRDEP
ncbi:LANO_0H13014g1_1 [Lachancea nothofagi CBS 11611]|uniref:DASH complex subunit ASK1 n=1 Tax=Lachancea nothofagi CBS 11611 TaxID=1266666 RepID=A0A1G4KMN9_9SACH|nr:LANO_0H13014g1_1 [Lachancea nothofagi CBS 11611]